MIFMRIARVWAFAGIAAAAAASEGSAHAFDKHECVKASDQGQALRIDGHLFAAREQLLVCADASCPATVRSSCADWLASLDAQLPTLVFVVKEPDGRDVAGARVWVDGKALPASVDGRAVAIDPGTHTLRVAAPTGEAVEQTVVVREGEVRRPVQVTLTRRAPATDEPSPSAPAGATTSWTAWGFAIGAGVAWATFGAFALSGHLQYKDLEASCDHKCGDDAYSPVNTKFIVADVALGVAVVATGIATWLFLTSPRTPSATRARLWAPVVSF
jgi:hypothetical protein